MYISNKCCFFSKLPIHQRMMKKCIIASNTIFSSTTVFNIDNNEKCFLKHQIILKLFLKDHVTLKRVMALPWQEYILNYTKIIILNYNNISQYDCFTVFFIN